jgi:hypothetical protein
LDSGCSRHMCGNIHELTDAVAVDGPKVTFGDSKEGKIKAKGRLIKGNIEISDVSYVKGLKYNLLSISQFCDKGYSVIFSTDKCYVEQIGTKKVILSGRRQGNIYIVDWNSADKNSSICLVASAPSEVSWLWHKRMNHLNFKTINRNQE